MLKIFWIANIKSKTNPNEVITKTVWTLGEHETIARDKILNLLNLNIKKNNISYHSEDIISITKLKEENCEIGNPCAGN